MLSMMVGVSSAAGASPSSPPPTKGERVGLLEDEAGPAPSSSSENPPAVVVEFGENCLFMLRALSVVTMISGGAVIAVNLFLMIETKQPVRMYAVRSYNVLFGLLMVAAEIDRPEILLDYVRFLKCWPSKGLFIGFVGVLTLDTEAGEESLLQTATAVLAVSVGILYFVLGLMCLRVREPSAVDEDDKLVDEFVALEENAPSWLDPTQDHPSSTP